MLEALANIVGIAVGIAGIAQFLREYFKKPKDNEGKEEDSEK